MQYEVRKEKGGRYYVCPEGHPEEPIKGSHGEKKKALKLAARLCGMNVKEYLKERKENSYE